jgi:hypothetical protein
MVLCDLHHQRENFLTTFFSIGVGVYKYVTQDCTHRDNLGVKFWKAKLDLFVVVEVLFF